VRGRLESVGLTIRAGLHTGEVDLIEGKALGIALHIATRIAAKANPGEVLVSGTTRELATGSDLDFADKGEHMLKGVTEPKRLYAALDPRAVSPDQPARLAAGVSRLDSAAANVSVGSDPPTALR
jgi:class 3 adenylate cyclase